jgi:peptidylprolyl isomerase
VTTVKSSRVSPAVALAACAAALVMTVASCGSDAETSSAGSSSASTPSVSEYFPSDVTTSAEAPAANGCPTAPPQAGGAPEWKFSGATGSVAVTGSTDTAAPLVTVDGPFSVNETKVQTLKAGAGPVVADTATVYVCYMGVNGRDGSVFDSSYERGEPVDFPLSNVVPGFQKAIAGQKVGSTVAVAMTSADGYPEGQPSAGIEKGDSLVFAIKILDASN